MTDRQRAMLISILLAVFVAAVISDIDREPKPTPAPVEEPVPSSPEQPHYVVFYFVCGHLEHVMVPTDPPMTASKLEPMTDEMQDVLRNVPIEHVIELRYVGPECFYRPNTPQTPVEPI